MPLQRSTDAWIDREAEQRFTTLLDTRQPRVVPMIGAGGMGKTSLLRRFFAQCEQRGIPALYIDLPRLETSDALEVLLRLEAVHAKQFADQRAKLIASYAALAEVFKAYGGHAASAADLLQKSAAGDAELGIVVGAVKDIGKIVAEFWQRQENQAKRDLLQKPEESLLRALRSDFADQGVILIDTLEQARNETVQTCLRFLDSGEIETPAAAKNRSISFLDYCGGMGWFLLDQPVLMLLAGRPSAQRELGGLPPRLFDKNIELAAFDEREIADYLRQTLPRAIADPSAADIRRLARLTHGNPFLVERVVRLLSEWQPVWDWSPVQWQPLEDSFNSDDRYGLLQFVTQRLTRHLLPDDQAFWRLALPRYYVHRNTAELLFPKAEFGNLSGAARLAAYEDKGTIFRLPTNPDHYYLHDETRSALEAWAQRQGCWLNATAANVHRRLAQWLEVKTGWKQIKHDYAGRKISDVPPERQSPHLLEAAYHRLLAFEGFEARFPGRRREGFWSSLVASLSLSHAEKLNVAKSVPELSVYQLKALLEVFDDELAEFRKFLGADAQDWLMEQSRAGGLPADWARNRDFLEGAVARFPRDAGLLGMLSSRYEKDNPDRVQILYEQAVAADPKHSNNLGNFAVFMENERGNMDRAEALYEQAVTADPKHANNLGNFAVFMENVRGDMDRAEVLYEQAVAADPKHANNLGNFAVFMKNVRGNMERAEALYEQAVVADPKHANNLGNFAVFMENVRGNMERAEALYEQAVVADPKSANNLGNFAVFMKDVRGNMERAEALYEQAVAADPKHVNNLGNLSQLLLIGDKLGYGRELLERAFDCGNLHPGLELELWFYRHAHFHAEYAEASTSAIERLLETGARSAGWDFSCNMLWAEQHSHPEVAKLREWARRIAA